MKAITQLPRPIVSGLLLILVLAVVYIFVYQTAPFPEPWTDLYLNLAIALPAILAAYLASMVYRSFQPGEGPRRVWLFFALSLWSWAIAEVVWLLTLLLVGEVPDISLSDLFWLLGLPCFAVSFVLQYRLIFSTTRRQEAVWFAAILAMILAFSAVGTVLLLRSATAEETSWRPAFLQVFYVATDLAMMVASLKLARLFGRGLWGRAWWGLLAFVISDALYSYVEISGLYAQSVERGNLLSLITDCTYAVAYMLMALACWSQLLLVRHGPSLVPQPEI